MKLVDKKGKLFGLVNIFDLLVLIMVAFVIVIVVAKIDATTSEDHIVKNTLYVTCEIADVRDVSLEAVEVGELLKEYDSAQIFGEVVSKSYKPHVEVVATSDGTLAYPEEKGKYDMELIIKVEANEGPYSTTVATKDIGVGRHVVLIGKRITVESLVIGIDEELSDAKK